MGGKSFEGRGEEEKDKNPYMNLSFPCQLRGRGGGGRAKREEGKESEKKLPGYESSLPW